MQKGNELKAQLYLEGRSVPFSNATIQARAGQSATCSINLPPLRDINDILPRTMVHLFVKDFTAPESKGAKPWVLAFEGEVYGYSMGKSTNERSFTIYCMDLSNYWDNAKQFYMNQRTSMGDAVSIFAAARDKSEAVKENAKVEMTIAGVSSYITNLINEQLKAGKGIIEAVTRVIKGVEDINPFFRYANARYRINDRIIFQDSGNINDIFDFSNSENLFEMMAGRGNGGSRTIRQIVMEIMSMIFHEFVSCPFPSKTGVVKRGIGPNKSQTVGSFMFKPTNFMLPPPKCNILFPDLYGNFSFNRIFFHEVTRIKMSPNLTNSDQIANKVEAFNQVFYAPSAFSEYRTGSKGGLDRPQYKNAGASGKHGDDAKDVIKNSTVLGDFNFLSFEEVLKGIFSDQDNVMPSAQILSKIKPLVDQKPFFEVATDFLFYKKRLASRQASASGGLNLSPVPGFTMLLMDDSSAEQHVIGTLMGLTHSISPDSGGMTSYDIGYARYLEEKDLWTGSAEEPPIPPWYSSEIFGRRRPVEDKDLEPFAKNKEAQDRLRDMHTINDFGNSKLGEHYQALLGKNLANSHYGSEPITNPKFPSLLAATMEMLRRYRNALKSGSVLKFISIQTRRDYVELTELFQFLGAEIPAHQKNASRQDKVDVIFKGNVFDGGFTGTVSDKENARDRELKNIFGNDATQKRRRILNIYRKRLFTERGFRG